MTDTVAYRIAIAGSETAFDCAPNQSVLNAALRAGIELPYSCRKGVCGNCAGHVSKGTLTGVDGAAIRNETCLPDQVLLCMCTPQSDMEIIPAWWRHTNSGAPKRFTAKVFRNALAAADVSILELRLPAGQRARFQAGQYLQLAVGDGSTRCYSMANSPSVSDAVTLHIRHVPTGAFSARVPALQKGDLIDIELPFGAVALDANAFRPIVFVAGGTGFAPIKSILDDMIHRQVQRDITLVWAVRESAGIYLRTAVAKWQKQWPSFRFIEAVSDDSGDVPEGIFAGRADAALAVHCPELADSELYCCGSPAMVNAVRETAIRRCKLDAQSFHADVFVNGPGAPD
jgi:NAD(P)H-flavin reductase/ferredoxin